MATCTGCRFATAAIHIRHLVQNAKLYGRCEKVCAVQGNCCECTVCLHPVNQQDERFLVVENPTAHSCELKEVVNVASC